MGSGLPAITVFVSVFLADLHARAEPGSHERVPSDRLTGSDGGALSAPLDAAREDYALYCASCHGERGGGDGPLSAVLDPRPASLARAGLVEMRSDAYLYQIIEQGGAALGRSEQMAAWGKTLSATQIANLVAYIRQLAAAEQPRTAPD